MDNQEYVCNNTYTIQPLSFVNLDTKSCITSLATLSGLVTITGCPGKASIGSTVTIGSKLKNTGTSNNNSFILIYAVSELANPTNIIKQGNSYNDTGSYFDLAPGSESSVFNFTFTMPSFDVGIVITAQADTVYSY